MIDIIYEDDYIIALNKKSGILVTPNNPTDKNLTDELSDFFANRGDKYKAHPCHRLDKETSGVILFAKGKKTQKTMMELFATRDIKKFYIAIIKGKLAKNEGEISTPIDGKQALTEYNVISANNDYSIVYIQLHTGRTNQIRIHFASIGHPLLGETKFAYRRDFAIKFKRVALHCDCIEFRNPFNGKDLSLNAELPTDMKSLIKK